MKIEAPAPRAEEEIVEFPDVPGAPRGYKPGVRFYSRFGRYTVQLTPTVVETHNGARTLTKGKVCEFKDGVYTPKSREEYDLLAIKWLELYRNVPPETQPEPGRRGYRFWEAADDEIQPIAKKTIVMTGPKTTAANPRMAPDR